MKTRTKTALIILTLIALTVCIRQLNREATTVTAAETTAITEIKETTTAAEESPRLNAREILEAIDEVTPTLEAKCPYGKNSKCVANVQYSYTNSYEANWDVYVYVDDGIIGTWIVNDSGIKIDFYGNAYSRTNDNYNVCIDDKIWVYPSGENGEEFMVVVH